VQTIDIYIILMSCYIMFDFVSFLNYRVLNPSLLLTTAVL